MKGKKGGKKKKRKCAHQIKRKGKVRRRGKSNPKNRADKLIEGQPHPTNPSLEKVHQWQVTQTEDRRIGRTFNKYQNLLQRVVNFPRKVKEETEELSFGRK